MEKIFSFIRSITPEGFNAAHYVQFAGILVVGVLVIALIGRLLFGKRSALNHAVSAAIAILCIYVVNVVVYSTGIQLKQLLSPLPYVTIEGDYLRIVNLLSMDFTQLCPVLLDMVILAFLVNLLDSWLPQGKKLIGWFLFRILSVVLAICLQYIVALVLGFLVPDGLAQIAPTVLLIILVAALLLGALKLLVGGALGFINPLLGVLYTFFFANVVGKQLSRAILTTGILTGLVCLMNYLSITSVYIASAALAAYLPLLVVVLVLWYVVAKLL